MSSNTVSQRWLTSDCEIVWDNKYVCMCGHCNHPWACPHNTGPPLRTVSIPSDSPHHLLTESLAECLVCGSCGVCTYLGSRLAESWSTWKWGRMCQSRFEGFRRFSEIGWNGIFYIVRLRGTPLVLIKCLLRWLPWSVGKALVYRFNVFSSICVVSYETTGSFRGIVCSRLQICEFTIEHYISTFLYTLCICLLWLLAW